MSTQLQIRRDTSSNISASAPAVGEIWYDTTNKRLTVGDGSNVGGIEVPNYIDLQNGTFDYALATGTANAIAVTTAPSNPSAYVSGQRIKVKIATTNTGSTTINWGSLGVKTIRKWSSGSLIDLIGGELIAGMIIEFVYDGTYFQIASGTSSQGTDWQAYTPTFQGVGTVSAVSFIYQVVGKTLNVIGTFTTGSVNNVEFQLSLPSGFSTSALIPSSLIQVGRMLIDRTGTTFDYYILAEPSKSYLVYGGRDASGTHSPLVKRSGNFLVYSSHRYSVQFSVPIA